MSEKKQTIYVRTNLVSLSAALTALFIVFKLLGIIDWSWWWVFSPILIKIFIASVVWIIVAGFCILVGILVGIFENKK